MTTQSRHSQKKPTYRRKKKKKPVKISKDIKKALQKISNTNNEVIKKPRQRREDQHCAKKNWPRFH